MYTMIKHSRVYRRIKLSNDKILSVNEAILLHSGAYLKTLFGLIICREIIRNIFFILKSSFEEFIVKQYFLENDLNIFAIFAPIVIWGAVTPIACCESILA